MGNCEQKQSEQLQIVDINQIIYLKMDQVEFVSKSNQEQQEVNVEIEDKLDPQPVTINLPRFNFNEKKYINAEDRPAFRLVDGSIYAGEWIGDQMTGNGVLKGKNRKYEGQFENVMKQGRGRFTFQNGEVYEGELKDDQEDGKGKFKWPNGRIYDGEYQYDQKKWCWYDGEWKEGKMEVNGRLTKNEEIKVGLWHDNKFIGGKNN